MQPDGELGRAADLQPALLDRARMFLGDIVGVNLDIIKPCQVGTKNTAKRPATHNADLHSHLSSVRSLTLDRPLPFIRFGVLTRRAEWETIPSVGM